ncbi:hypothetical protein B0H17DRAFT_1141282 [Mycena rosella]|uniref:Alpha-type protein kinase domain-containing protein n=1 Tax=Mycena rosella TaxID=1033263 RepID=A0AAD7D083_MYCRO|nr:hypothetical protein B0H17DRAFT_1141282 [Mycena rosella]
MNYIYSFIYHFVNTANTPPPFDIPKIHFFHAAIAVVNQQVVGPAAKATANICRTYLVEELINEEQDGFHKFINNGSAVPVILSATDKSLPALGEFLPFTQHVQYYKTGGLVYISDLQGSPNALTDPQIMTTP